MSAEQLYVFLKTIADYNILPQDKWKVINDRSGEDFLKNLLHFKCMCEQLEEYVEARNYPEPASVNSTDTIERFDVRLTSAGREWIKEYEACKLKYL